VELGIIYKLLQFT